MPDSDWIFAADDSKLPEGGKVTAHCAGVHVLLARVGGSVYAVSDKCVHMACPLIRGALDGFVITCPCHDWRFDVRTGRFLDAPELGLEVYPVKSEAGRLFVNVSKGAAS